MVCIVLISVLTLTLAAQDGHQREAQPIDMPTALDVQVVAKQRAKMKLLIVTLASDSSLKAVAEFVQKDCMWSGQCDVAMQECAGVHKKEDIQAFASQGYPLAVFISKTPDGIAWRLYDTRNVRMIAGKLHRTGAADARITAHAVADELWPLLTGNSGIFSTRIAYCKEVPSKKGARNYKHICIADYDGSNEQVIVKTPTINMAPRWNGDPNRPLLFFSESTKSNIRLMSVTMQGKRSIASNFDGLNICPAFSADGKKLVYCASRGGGCCQLYYYDEHQFKRLTFNNGNNVSPTLSADGTSMYYCSDAATGKPAIYAFNLLNGIQQPITTDGSNFCPSYCQKKEKVAYCKLVNGFCQIFIYDVKQKTHEQLTFDASNKDECVFSPCGTYLMTVVEQGRSSRLARINLVTKERSFITPVGVHCSYPAWSPVYQVYPEVVT